MVPVRLDPASQRDPLSGIIQPKLAAMMRPFQHVHISRHQYQSAASARNIVHLRRPVKDRIQDGPLSPADQIRHRVADKEKKAASVWNSQPFGWRPCGWLWVRSGCHADAGVSGVSCKTGTSTLGVHSASLSSTSQKESIPLGCKPGPRAGSDPLPANSRPLAQHPKHPLYRGLS